MNKEFLDELHYEYQKKIYNQIVENFDLNNEDCMDNLYRITYNIFLDSSIDNLNLLKITDLFEINKINQRTLVWPFIEAILFIKIILESDVLKKQKILNFIISGDCDDSDLIEKRFNRILNENFLKTAKIKLKESKKEGINSEYYWAVSLLTKQLQGNLYQFNNNLQNFKYNDGVINNMNYLKSILGDIDNLYGDD